MSTEDVLVLDEDGTARNYSGGLVLPKWDQSLAWLSDDPDDAPAPEEDR